jgi:hypothetical protein
MTSYSPPAWGEPNSLYSIDVIKDGALQEVYDLADKSFFSIGRSETCDFQLLHQSISRVHAILQLGQGKLFIYDLGSTHCSSINKKSVQACQYHRLYAGDLIEFGKSSRSYFVNGPEDDARPPSEPIFDQAGRLNPSLTKASRYKQKIEGITAEAAFGEIRTFQLQSALQEVTWGLGEDAQEDVIGPENEGLYAEKLDLEAIRARPDIKGHHVKLINQIEQKRKKLDSLGRELGNLERKEGDDNLSEGQLLRRHKLAEQTREMTDELEAAEDKLRAMFIDQDEPFIPKRPKEDSDMEDEYYDRTLKREFEPQATFETMQERLDRLTAEQTEIVENLTGLDQFEVEEDEDSLETYMKDVTLKLKTDHIEAFRLRLTEVNAQIDAIRVAIPHLQPSVLAPALLTPVAQEAVVRPARQYTATPKPLPRNDTEDMSLTDETLELMYGDKEVKAQQLQAAKVLIDRVWEPPAGQRGDGKNQLNERYGY